MIGSIFNIIGNVLKNAVGSERDLLQLIQDKDISTAMSMFEDHSRAIRQALAEYNPDTHEVMSRRDKPRKNRDDYITEKLPLAWQEFINEIALFFLLANPIEWRADAEDNEAFIAFKDMIRELRFDAYMRMAKRTAGSETLCAKLYRLYQRGNVPKVEIVMLSHSRGWDVRPLFDRFGHLLACGYGYYTNEGGKTTERFDIHTPKAIYCCKRNTIGWEISEEPNITGKINIIVCQQNTEWEKVQRLINRSEMIGSKEADTNNYFADPIAKASADVINSLADPDKPGKVIAVQGQGSMFEYIDPPTSSELQREEKDSIRNAILQFSLTPDFDFKAMSGLGTLSGEALRRALILGYIKRARNIEIYEPLVDREKNLILTIMEEVTHVGMKAKIQALRKSLKFAFAEPFSEDVATKISNLSQAVSAGILSVDEAVARLGMVEDIDSEIERLARPKASERANSEQ